MKLREKRANFSVDTHKCWILESLPIQSIHKFDVNRSEMSSAGDVSNVRNVIYSTNSIQFSDFVM